MIHELLLFRYYSAAYFGTTIELVATSNSIMLTKSFSMDYLEEPPKAVALSPPEKEELIEILNQSGFWRWKKNIETNECVMDGESWEMNFVYNENTSRSSGGYCSYPDEEGKGHFERPDTYSAIVSWIEKKFEEAFPNNE
jgi:hypothetical protein